MHSIILSLSAGSVIALFMMAFYCVKYLMAK